MLFNFPLVPNPVEMATAVKNRTKEIEWRNKTSELRGNGELSEIPDVIVQSLMETISPYLEPYIEQKVKEELKKEIPEQAAFYKSHIAWFIVLPIITALIVYYGLKKK